MRRQSPFFAFGLAFLALAGNPVSSPARAAESSPLPGLDKKAGAIVQKALVVIETLEALEEITRRTGPAKGKAPYKGSLESIELRAKFLLRNVEAERTSYNAIAGITVPGSAVLFRARGNVAVFAAIDLGKVRVSRDKAGAVTVSLPKFTVSAQLLHDGQLTYEIHYGKLHNPKLPISRARAEALRPDVLQDVQDAAVEQFTGSDLDTYRKAFAAALQKELRAKFPKHRITVK
jgi:hypothetical protein